MARHTVVQYRGPQEARKMVTSLCGVIEKLQALGLRRYKLEALLLMSWMTWGLISPKYKFRFLENGNNNSDAAPPPTSASLVGWDGVQIPSIIV